MTESRNNASAPDATKLTPDDRKKARERYQEIKQLSSEKRAAVLQKRDEYRNLSPEKQEEMRKKAAASKTIHSADSGSKTTPKYFLRLCQEGFPAAALACA
jgi:hypothetical protein